MNTTSNNIVVEAICYCLCACDENRVFEFFFQVRGRVWREKTEVLNLLRVGRSGQLMGVYKGDGE